MFSDARPLEFGFYVETLRTPDVFTISELTIAKAVAIVGSLNF